MKITQDMRDYAATLNEKQHEGFGAKGEQIPSEIQKGMDAMSDKFNAMGQHGLCRCGEGEGE